jgi:hypothetical protein
LVLAGLGTATSFDPSARFVPAPAIQGLDVGRPHRARASTAARLCAPAPPRYLGVRTL